MSKGNGRRNGDDDDNRKLGILTKWAGLGSSLRPGTEGNTQYDFFYI
jgi:hypothetical protein